LISENEFQRTIEAGQRNLEAQKLIRNWCSHAKIEKLGGIGLIEMQTGLPIGHHMMVCDHAPNGGWGTWLLEESAIQFHDSYCASCTKRQPVRLPNISTLVARRDWEYEQAQLRQEAEQRQLKSAFDLRCSVRNALRSISPVSTATFLEDLESLDATRDIAISQRLIESIHLAPELLTEELEHHLFTLLEEGECWSDEASLSVLSFSSRSPSRLASCALQCLKEMRCINLAAGIATGIITHVDAKEVVAAVKGLSYVANPLRSPFSNDSTPENPAPLHRFYEYFPTETIQGIKNLISDRNPYHVRAGACSVKVLSSAHPELPLELLSTLATRLSRAEILIDTEYDSELRHVIHDLSEALICALMTDPLRADTELMSYFDSASHDGEAHISGVYERMIRLAARRENDKNSSSELAPYRTALRRLLTLSGTSENDKVIQDVIEALRGDPRELTPLACEQMDILLGMAIVIDDKVNTSAEDSPLLIKEDPWAPIERQNRLQRLWYLRASCIRWAVHGAATNETSLTSFTEFLSKTRTLSEELTAVIVEELPPLIKSSIGLSSLLPFLYTCMVGDSVQLRAASAKAIGEISTRRFNELPSLIGEAFLLMLYDPYVHVHKSSVRALRQINLPESLQPQVIQALSNLIKAYRGNKDQEFLLTCIDVYVSHIQNEARFKSGIGKILIGLLDEVEPELLTHDKHQWLIRKFSDIEGYAPLVLDLLNHCEHEYATDNVLELVRDIPINTIGQHIDLIKKAIANAPQSSIIIGTFLEVLSRDAEWNAALQIAKSYFDSVPNTTRMRAHWLLSLQQRYRVEFELLISQNDIEGALSIGHSWDAAELELNQILKK